MTFAERLEAFLREHTPSVTDWAEEEMASQYTAGDTEPFARQCSCGEKLYGVYEYIDHLQSVAYRMERK